MHFLNQGRKEGDKREGKLVAFCSSTYMYIRIYLQNWVCVFNASKNMIYLYHWLMMKVKAVQIQMFW
jgi:hypothetical protein